MRGKPLCSRPPTAENRITPADAGKTQSPAVFTAMEKDHPRGCGENRNINQNFHQTVGSPPRMRGKHGQKILAQAKAGITPADAGKTDVINICKFKIQDHPRGCGEN